MALKNSAVDYSLDRATMVNDNTLATGIVPIDEAYTETGGSPLALSLDKLDASLGNDRDRVGISADLTFHVGVDEAHYDASYQIGLQIATTADFSNAVTFALTDVVEGGRYALGTTRGAIEAMLPGAAFIRARHVVDGTGALRYRAWALPK